MDYRINDTEADVQPMRLENLMRRTSLTLNQRIALENALANSGTGDAIDGLYHALHDINASLNEIKATLDTISKRI